jgi:S-adenosylmethionine synthetase
VWIDRKTYDALRLDYAKANEEARVLDAQNIALRTTLDWLMLRMTFLEKERAVMIQHYMGITLEVPEVSPARSKAAQVPLDIPAMLGHPPGMFSDIGDEAARKLGLDWDKDSGEVISTT